MVHHGRVAACYAPGDAVRALRETLDAVATRDPARSSSANLVHQSKVSTRDAGAHASLMELCCSEAVMQICGIPWSPRNSEFHAWAPLRPSANLGPCTLKLALRSRSTPVCTASSIGPVQLEAAPASGRQCMLCHCCRLELCSVVACRPACLAGSTSAGARGCCSRPAVQTCDWLHFRADATRWPMGVLEHAQS